MTSLISNARKALPYAPPPVRVRREGAGRAAAAAAMRFRGAAAEAQRITAREWLLSGPAETGKTWAALYRLDAEARKWPNSQWVIARKVRTTMDSTVLNTWRRIIALRGGVEVFGGEKPVFYTYPNGARVWVVGFDNPDKILSGEFDGIYVNQAEELDAADWETATSRATGRGATTDTPMVWGDCNPGAEDHWVMLRRQAGALTLLESRHEDNPTLYDEQGRLTEQGVRTMAVLDALTGVRYLRLRKGLWVGAEGAYFAQLDERLHLSDLERVPPGWRVYAALDYGFAHPLSFGIFAYSPWDDLHLIGLHHQARWFVPQHAAAMDALLEDLGVDKDNLVVHAGHDCWASRGGDDPETIADKFQRHGYRLQRATIARVAGARAVSERLGNPEAEVAPSLFIARRAWGAFQTLARMVPDPHNPEDVKKVDADAEGRGGDDDYDMLRYGVMAAPAKMGATRPTENKSNPWRELQ